MTNRATALLLIIETRKIRNSSIPIKPNLSKERGGKSRVFFKKIAELPKDGTSSSELGFFIVWSK